MKFILTFFLLSSFIPINDCFPFNSNSSGERKEFYIDFGSSAFTTPGNWNNFPENQTTLPSKQLKDWNGNPTSFIFSVETAASTTYGQGINTEGLNSAFKYFPASACRDSYYSYGAGGTYKLKELNPLKYYTIEIFGWSIESLKS